MTQKPIYEELEQRVKALEKLETEREQAAEELKKRAEQFLALHEISLEITKPHDVSELLQKIVERAAHLLEGTGGGMYLCDSEKKEVRCVVSYQTLRDFTGTVLKYGEGAAGIVAQSGEPLIVDDYTAWTNRAGVFEQHQPFKSVVSVPLIWQNEIIGVIHVLDTENTDRFTKDDLSLLDLFANQAVIAIQNARLVNQTRTQTEELKKGNEELNSEIAERKQAEDALRESERRLLKAQEVARMGFLDWNLKTNELYWSDEIYNLYGINRQSEKSNIDRTMELVHPDDMEFVEKNLDMAIQGVKKYDLDHRKLRHDGKIIWVHAQGELVRDADGNPESLLGTVVDITERKQAEEALRESESELRQAQKMESIGTLAGGIAHEFNNILGIIIGNTELAIDDVPEWNPAKECLKEIRAASMRAKDVVRHILSFARKTPAQRQPIQISTIIRDSLKLMRASIPTTIEIRQNISGESEMILADPTEVNQILMNLCTNSVHALSEETGVLEVSLESINLDKDSASQYENLNTGNFVKLTVKDTGQGIDPKIMDQIFDPYFTTKDIGEGIGMGLAVVYGIVKKHDGAIKASSEFGIGTVVEVLFPLIEETEEPEVKDAPEVLPTGNERILFVDDEVSLVKMADQTLERLGYQVVTRTDPKEALALFKAEADRFDLVITDMAMPQMAGDRLAQELMKIRQDIPVILCTGHSARIDEDRAKELGLAAYVMKPLVMKDFAKTVRKVLDAAKE